MLGPAINVKGGISSLEKIILSHSNNDIIIDFKPTMTDKSLIGRAYHWLARILSLPFYIYYNKPDIIHIHISHSLSTLRKLTLLRICKIFRAKVILHAHSSDYRLFFPRQNRVIKRLIINSFNKADHLIVLSNSWKEYYSQDLKFNLDKISIMPTPVIIPIVKNEFLPNENGIVLFSGRVGERKGVFELMNAWDLIPPSIIKSNKLIIIGDGDLKKAKKMASLNKNSKSISIKGWVTDEERDKLMQECIIYALPSKNEGMPMGMMEAMANKKAIIVTPVGGIPELVTNRINGVLITPGSVDELKCALEELLQDLEFREAISSQALESVRPHGIDKYMLNMEKLWSSFSS